MAVLINDTFTDTNGTALASHTVSPTNTPGNSWVAETSTWTIQSNGAQSTGTGYATIQSGIANVDITANPSFGSTGFTSVGLVLRWVDSSNFIIVRLDENGDQVLLTKVVSGSGTNIATAAVTLNTSTTYLTRVIANGSSWKVYIDGNLLIDTTDSTHSTATKHGLLNWSTSSNFILDFQLSDISSAVGRLTRSTLLRGGILAGRLT